MTTENVKNLKEHGEMILLPIEMLEHHPDNPRKDLGDLSELTDSIKKNGILQNLTVVPHEDRYYVVIGNRRMEAAKKAGLLRLPCVVSDMNRQEQVLTMLAENMQRNDLTIYEQGWGFQLAMDLGETVKSIAEKSGFSPQTVKRRAKLCELDQEKLQKVSYRQISVDELDRLNRIEDPKIRNMLLDFIGTPNFNNQCRRELDAQNRRNLEKRWRKVLTAAGLKEINYHRDCFGNTTYKCSKRPYLSCTSISPSDYVRAKDEEFFAFNYGSVYFRREATPEERKGEARDTVRQRERQYAQELLKEATARMFHLRRDFVFSVSEAQAKSHFDIITEFLIRNEWDSRMDGGYWARYQRERFSKEKLDVGKGYSQIKDYVENHPCQALLRHAWVLSADQDSLGYVDYSGAYRKNGRLDLIYEMLEKLGYEICDEELQLKNGTHPLFTKEEK